VRESPHRVLERYGDRYCSCPRLGGMGLSGCGEDNVKYPRIWSSQILLESMGRVRTSRNRTYALSSYLFWSFGHQYSPAVQPFMEFAEWARADGHRGERNLSAQCQLAGMKPAPPWKK
jgi:hypothetical protein